MLKRYRKDFNYSYTLGIFPTLELLFSRTDLVTRVVLHSNATLKEGVRKILEICEKRGIRIDISDKCINRLAGDEKTYAIGVFEKLLPQVQSGNHLVLVNPAYRGNLGTIIRTMIGCTVDNLVVITPAVDIFHPAVVRSSMGSLFRINFTSYSSISEYLSVFPNKPYCFMTDGKTELNQVFFKEPFAMIFGNESTGLTQEYQEMGTSVRIPQSAEVDSLNLAVSVGMALYHQNLQKGTG